jgi:nicotinamide riboside kinase
MSGGTLAAATPGAKADAATHGAKIDAATHGAKTNAAMHGAKTNAAMRPRRIAVLGAESSGKSTLAAALAGHYGTLWVPEYLREFVETEGRVPRADDQFGIAATQQRREDEAAARASAFLFCDTTPLMTAVYSLHYFHGVDAGLARLAARHDYARTLVTAPDAPWEPDGLQRESAAVRQQVHGLLIGELQRRGIPYMLLRGELATRMEQAREYLAAGLSNAGYR